MPVFCVWCQTSFDNYPKPNCNNPEFHNQKDNFHYRKGEED